ncbi:hypothetical protein AAMO2058_000306600 [Amorphochlora amoebiformis]
MAAIRATSALRRPIPTRRLFSSENLNPNQLKSCFSMLDHMSVVRIRGEDAEKFLQGFTTNNVPSLSQVGHSQYSLWLNQRGRYMHDSIIIRAGGGFGSGEKKEEEDEFHLLCERSSVAALLNHIKKFKFRSKVLSEDISDTLDVWSVLSTDIGVLNLVVEGNTACTTPSIFDPRTPAGSTVPPLGALVCTPKGSLPQAVDELVQVDASIYDAYRCLQGIPRSGVDLFREDSLILEANADWLSGVSFSKGCYLGQELTARSHHTGVIRKRLMPVALLRGGERLPISAFERLEASDFLFPEWLDLETEIDIPSGESIRAGGKAAGKLFGTSFNVGIAQVRLKEASTATDGLVCMEYDVVPIIPSWWPDSFTL